MQLGWNAPPQGCGTVSGRSWGRRGQLEKEERS
jgi:hypothetical protein